MLTVSVLGMANAAHSIEVKKQPLTQTVKKQYPKQYTDEKIKEIKSLYKSNSKDEVIYVALDMLKGTGGEYSRKAIMGYNLSSKPMKIEFKNLGEINPNYKDFDALGWKKRNRLYIYINEKHSDAPAIALAALLAHEAVHQDEFNSLNEETYAWTMEAAVWTELTDMHKDYKLGMHPLVTRENMLKRLLQKGSFSNKYIRKTVYTNPGYKNLPQTSPGFETL